MKPFKATFQRIHNGRVETNINVFKSDAEYLTVYNLFFNKPHEQINAAYRELTIIADVDTNQIFGWIQFEQVPAREVYLVTRVNDDDDPEFISIKPGTTFEVVWETNSDYATEFSESEAEVIAKFFAATTITEWRMGEVKA